MASRLVYIEKGEGREPSLEALERKRKRRHILSTRAFPEADAGLFFSYTARTERKIETSPRR